MRADDYDPAPQRPAGAAVPPARPPQSRCRSCRAAIIWAKTEATGKAIPLDAAPNGAGNVTVRNRGGVLVATVHGNGHVPDSAAVYMPHFSTCPNYGKGRR